MTIKELQEVVKCSSGTIGIALETHSYYEIDLFVKWLFLPVGKCNDLFIGQIAAFGDNVLSALANAVTCYNRHGKR